MGQLGFKQLVEGWSWLCTIKVACCSFECLSRMAPKARVYVGTSRNTLVAECMPMRPPPSRMYRDRFSFCSCVSRMSPLGDKKSNALNFAKTS